MKIFKNWVFKWWEVSLLKISLMSFGILLGLYFYDYLVNLKLLWWSLFVLIAIYFIPKTFKNDIIE